ncbi:insulin-like growth factor-binding protein complex acid labile subunit [Drosophila innubila]|uniref:insulin-like growth factor-binding protein complex acid labile subunit n=1 Tax=Drosophila innubila TaxID=198719 RepID=UPI00148BDA2C|nr:insulin-like growth factor-binding protein complex acid labile subunit [Drosophila innubila]
MAFFELPTKVHIAPDGATYELGEEERLVTLIMENATFVNFPLHLFYELPQLSDLDMRHCNMRYVSWECFLEANKLKILLLSDNEIAQLDESSFSYASELEYLFISYNKLSSLHPDAFKGLGQLRHLDLSNNQLELLPEQLFEELSALQELVLAENKLRYISSELLSHNTRLQTVVLHTNQLQNLGEYAFHSAPLLLFVELSHNPGLEVLLLSLNAGHLLARNCSLSRVNLFGAVSNVDLDNNHLQELYFSTSEALEHLVLRNNSLQQLATLSNVPRLRHLNVADNPQLGDLPNDWQTPELERLDLSNTGLLQLPLEALRGMPQLRKLNVSANNISEINPQDFEQLTQLTHFYIHANNWNCFNLRLVMDMVIIQHGISYTVDKFNDDFPGEYIYGIECMYRLPEQEQMTSDMQQEVDSSSASSATIEYSQLVEPNVVEKLRQELKSVVQHFETRLDMVSGQLNTLNAKMQTLEHMNSSLWNQVSIRI